jgi:hypothetical protein
MSSWRAYVFPRGAWADISSSGTLITFGTSAIAARFAVNNWIQSGISTANIRKVSAVGGNSISVSGAAVIVSENDRIFIIGNTQPSVSGGSATYSIPQTTIYQRDDTAADTYTNSMVTSDANGLVQFYTSLGIYDVLIQDSNRSSQGYIADLPIGIVEGISTSLPSVFGAAVTINAPLGITGSVVIGGAASDLTVARNLTAGGALSVTGIATIGGAGGGLSDIQGRARFGSTATFSTNVGITGTLAVVGAATFGASGVVGGLSVTTGVFGVSNQPRALLLNSGNQSIPTSAGTRLTWDTESFNVGSLHSGSSSSINITAAGVYLLIGQVEWSVSGVTALCTATIKKNDALIEVAEAVDICDPPLMGLKQNIAGLDVAVAGDYYQLFVTQVSGATQTVSCTTGRLNSYFSAAKIA